MKISERRALSRSDLALTVLGLGSAPMGGLYSPTSFAEAQATTEAAWAHGIRYFDTAPYYGYTRSERRLGARCATASGTTISSARRPGA